NVSSLTTRPSIRYAGRLAGDPLGGLFQGEATLQSGGGVQLTLQHLWGDYTMLSVDPADDCTFWYTTEYYSTNSEGNSETRIGSFRFPACGGAPSTTSTPTSIPTATKSFTRTATPSATPSPSLPHSPTVSPSSTPTFTTQATATPSATWTAIPSPTVNPRV